MSPRTPPVPHRFDLRSFLTGSPPWTADRVGRAFGAASRAVAAAGGGTIFIPPGDWPIALNDTETSAGLKLGTSGMRLEGAGVRATRLCAEPGVDCDVVVIAAPGVGVSRLTIRGGLNDKTAPNRRHGIAVRSDATFTTLCDIVVEQAAGYAIFFRVPHDRPGTYAQISLHNVVVLDCGDDAIDFKVRHASQPKGGYPAARFGFAGPRAFLRNIVVQNHSALYPNWERPDRGENGVDVRGQVHMRNIEVLKVKPSRFGKGGAAGFTFRDETSPEEMELRHDHGRGANWSILENYFVSRLPPGTDPASQRGGGVLIGRRVGKEIFISNGNVVDIPAPTEMDLHFGR